MATATCPGEDGPASLPQPSPDVSRLEIQGAWSGDPKEPVHLKISMVAMCVPNSRLQLLSLKSPSVSLVNTHLVRSESSESSQGNHWDSTSPHSPLFAFSPSASGDPDLISPMNAVGSSHGSTVADTGISAATHDALPAAQSSPEGRSEHSIPPSSLHSPFTPGLHIHSSKYKTWMNLQSLGKRSAAAACLTDSECGSDHEKPNKKEQELDPFSDAAPTNPECTSEPRTILKGSSKAPSVISTLLTNNPSMLGLIPKPVTRSEQSPKEVVSDLTSRDNAVLTSSTPQLSISDGELRAAGDPVFPEPTCDLPVAMTPRNPATGIQPTSESTPSPEHADEVTPKPSNRIHEHSPAAESVPMLSTSNLGSTSSRSHVGLDTSNPKKKTTTGENILAASLGTPRQRLKITIPPSTPVGFACRQETSTCLSNQSTHSQKFSEPRFKLSQGILSVKCPSNIQSALYKLVVTISVYLRQDKPKEWNELVIRGLPQMDIAESGFLLFRIPESCGLEFRTTQLRRHKIVENCFFAEFGHTAELRLPIRRCSKSFYGDVKDFTLNQEVRFNHMAIPGTGMLWVKYDMVCSIRLYNRCFWAEKCRVSLIVDGAPEHSFLYELNAADSEDATLHRISLDANEDTPIGSCNIQIVCPPKNLDLFCLSWMVKLPFHQATGWLPKVYPAQSRTWEHNKSQLRHPLGDFECKSERSPCTIEERISRDEKEPKNEIITEGATAGLEGSVPLATDHEALSESLPTNDGQEWGRLALAMMSGLACFIYLMTWVYSMIWASNASLTTVTWPHKATFTVIFQGADVPRMIQSGMAPWPSYTGQLAEIRGSEVEVVLEPTQEFFAASADSNERESIIGVEPTSTTADFGPEWPVAEEVPNVDAPRAKQPLGFRDRVDYWLGWRGPVGNDHDGVYR
ncbi:hypothetical protein BO70DRAFT_421537 [Aspergillus heteromorphus CBS 117.55]|uniref:Uncharacterized protein n=1 Tax=Aspergillus heteromorphus CBS 117.55 TaxID=1448321 RepID=A0A317WQT6_9EURO|nr:uncharacterized protein BO70DRAFT_421537 [Aspergillus heteromorphus CBS 117.55]PWY87642.1 hypothetical protein BO70DRAFT_421537 [Aspergillus heteromorphus CBS 117.55]